MILVCHNENSAIYDNGDNWLWKADGQNDQIYEKIYDPILPLAAVIKWEMVTDDENIMNELRKVARQAA